MSTSLLRKDLLPEMTEGDIRTQVEYVYGSVIENTWRKEDVVVPGERLKSVFDAKDIPEVAELIKKAIENYESRGTVIGDAKVNVSYEDPDKIEELEMITILPDERLPGQFQSGRASMGSGVIRKHTPILMEEGPDPENPGYRLAVMSQWFDNIIQLNCWARSTKQANNRSIWLENLIQEYGWFFTASGIGRIIYEGRGKRITKDIQGNMIYGYPHRFFVQTQKITTVSEKALETLIIKVSLAKS